MNKLRSILIPLVILCFSCGHKDTSSVAEYMHFIADPGNGLVKEKKIGGIAYRVKYLPAEYLAYSVMKDDAEKKNRDSIIKIYDRSLTLLLTIGPAKGEDFDLTRVGVSSYSEFEERVGQLAFGTQEQITLESGGRTIKPVIVRLENLNSVERSRNFIVVFNNSDADDDILSRDFCFQFNDQVFLTGTNKFMFSSKDISDTPTFNF